MLSTFFDFEFKVFTKLSIYVHLVMIILLRQLNLYSYMSLVLSSTCLECEQCCFIALELPFGKTIQTTWFSNCIKYDDTCRMLCPSKLRKQSNSVDKAQ